MSHFPTCIFIYLLLPALCSCKDMHFRKLPEEKDIAFEGEVKVAPSQKTKPYVPNERRDIQLHLSSNDKEAEESTFKILSWKEANGKKGTLDPSSIHLGNNTLRYTPQEPGTHELTLKVAVEGEEDSAQTFQSTIEAPASTWQVTGNANNAGDFTLTIADAPKEWRNEPWRIQSTRWSRGLEGRITNNLTQVQAGETTLPITLQAVALTELPRVHLNIQGPDRAFQSITLDLREVCVAKLAETYNEGRIQTIREHNEAVRRQAATYQGNLTGNAREEAQRTLNRRLEETTRLRETTEAQLASLVSNLNILQEQDEADLAALNTRRTALQHAIEELNTSMNILQPMVTQLRASNTGSIDPWGMLYEALEQGKYNAANMAPHLASPLLSDAINQEGDQGKKLLHLAIEQGHIALSRSLIAQGAEVNIRDLSGKTPIQYATEAENQGAIALLLGTGAIQGLSPDWQLQGNYEADGQQLVLSIGDAPGRLQKARGEQAQWCIINTTWSDGINGQITPNLVLQHGENRFPVVINMATLTEQPTLQVSLQGPDRAFQSITLDLREVCVAKLAETYNEGRIQTIREHNEAVRRQAATYQGNLTGNAREEAQRTLNRRLEETTRLRETTEAQLASLVSNLNILQEQDEADLAALNTRRTALQHALEELNTSMNILQPMVTQLRASNTGSIDPWGVLHESLQQGQYDEASMAPHLASPLLSDEITINQEGDQGKKLLHLAIEQGHIALSNTLIAKGAEVNLRDQAGHTPLYYATEARNQKIISLLLRAGAVQNLPPDWQVQGSYEDADQHLVITIGDTPGRLQQARGEQAQWHITNTTWSDGINGQITPNHVLQHGKNRIPVVIKMATLTEQPTLQVLLQGPDRAFQDITLDLREVCVARLQEGERELTERSVNIDQYTQETETIYSLPSGTVTDPRVNREEQTKVETLLGELENFQRSYERDFQTLSSNLEALDQAQVNTQLPVLEANNKRLKDAIASLKSAQVQLQQQCITAEEALFKSFRYDNEQATETLLNDPNIDANRKDSQGSTLLHLAIRKGNIAAVRKLINLGSSVEEKEGYYTPLQRSIASGNIEITSFLIECGANLYVYEKHYDYANDPNYAYPPLLLACTLLVDEVRKYEDADTYVLMDLIRILLDTGIDPDMEYERLVPVQEYIQRCSMSSIEDLRAHGEKLREGDEYVVTSISLVQLAPQDTLQDICGEESEEVLRLENIFEMAYKNKTVRRPPHISESHVTIAPDWQLQGNYEADGQQLVLSIGDAPGRLQQARGEQARWRITHTTWSEGLDGQIAPNLVLQQGENRIPMAINMGTLTEAPTVQLLLQGPDRAFQDITLDLREVCVARLQEGERELTERSVNIDQYTQETEAIYQLPPETVTDPRVNRERHTEVGTLLGRLEAFQRTYERDLQEFSSNLEILDQAHINENLAVFEANNKRLKDAIASLKSAQVQLQQQCTTAHEALFKTLENENQEAIDILLEDPKLDVNAEDRNEKSLLYISVMRRNIYAIRKLMELNADTSCDINRRYRPFRDACYKGYTDIVAILLQCGVDVNQKDIDGQTPLHNAAAIDEDAGTAVVRMLLQRGAQVNERDNNGHTPLYDAVTNNAPTETVRVLLESAQRINEQNNSSVQTILTESIDYGHPASIIKMILNKGATVDGKNEEGETPLELIECMNFQVPEDVIELFRKK